MKLFEALNNIHFVGDGEGITFSRGCNDDIEPDDARSEVTEFIIEECLARAQEGYSWDDFERCKQLCIYGAALFNAIDQYDSDPNDHDPKG